MIELYYKIAGHLVCIKSQSDIAPYLPSFTPFVAQKGNDTLTVNFVENAKSPVRLTKVKDYDWFESVASLYTTADGFLWERVDTKDGSCSSVWWNGVVSNEFTVDVRGRFVSHVLEHLLLIAFNYATLDKQTLVLHSSVVVKNREAYMFLGESGTGKSTHCRLWVNHIEGAEMLNDDAPVVRVEGGQAVVYGSPWSGKGACYRNASAPIKGIYRLSQAPYNKLHKVNNIQAFSAVLPSCMPSLMEVEQHMDYVCATLSDIISHTSHFHLECLPNMEAAKLSYGQ